MGIWWGIHALPPRRILGGDHDEILQDVLRRTGGP
jgi:hypothetical protein